MRKTCRYLSALLGLTALASLAAVPLASAAPVTVTAAAGHVTPAVAYNGTTPYYKVAVKESSPGLFSCQAPESQSNPVPCYGPSQIRRAYDFPAGLNGAGQTIVIIDAFGDPYIASDLEAFDSAFGLPAANLNEICVATATTTGPCPTFSLSNSDQVDWAGEIALDTQWAHAIAPDATIDLVIAKSDNDPDILNAQEYAINNNLGSVLSQSFGENEACVQAESTIFTPTVDIFQKAEDEDMSVFASAGDQGAATFSCTNSGLPYVEGVNMPASDPLVTSVGGTHLNANFVTGAYQSETVWNNSGMTPDFGAGGGGFSKIFAKPSYQDSADTGSNFRGVPDVSYNADVYNGVLVSCTACFGGTQAFTIFGGTSSGSPQWAAFTALADQAAGHRLGFLNPKLYQIASSPLYSLAFHDITVGNNDWDVAAVGGYAAHRGWDAASGLGTPVAAELLGFLSGHV